MMAFVALFMAGGVNPRPALFKVQQDAYSKEGHRLHAAFG